MIVLHPPAFSQTFRGVRGNSVGVRDAAKKSVPRAAPIIDNPCQELEPATTPAASIGAQQAHLPLGSIEAGVVIGLEQFILCRGARRRLACCRRARFRA